ncbi:MAG: response regulator transcription factor, partial [Chthoniobacteraceae bacterium]
MKRRLIIVDSDELLRDTLAICLGADGDYEIIGQTGSGLEAVELCITERPHLLILDLMLPQLCGVEVLRRLRAAVPEQKVLVLTATTNSSLIIAALRSRPNGFVGKPTSLKALREAMNAVCAGSRYYSPIASQLLGESFMPATTISDLSRREREVIQLIAEG